MSFIDEEENRMRYRMVATMPLQGYIQGRQPNPNPNDNWAWSLHH